MLARDVDLSAAVDFDGDLDMRATFVLDADDKLAYGSTTKTAPSRASYAAYDSAAGVCDTKRTTRAQQVNWNADGTPDFGVPAPLEEELRGPSGE